MTDDLTIRPARPDEDDLLAEFFFHMWADNGHGPEQLKPDWKAATLAFMTETRSQQRARAFVAVRNDEVIGTAQAHLVRGLYPQVHKADVRTDGYIWGVYVRPSHRRQGVARALTQACVTYLGHIGCTRISLHASPGGRPVYEALEFAPTNELRLERLTG